MALVHGKTTVIKLNAKDLSAYTNTSELNQSGDSHDVTCYGATAHVYAGGLTDAKASLSGVYDSTAVSGPRAAIQPLIGTVVPLIRQPEGTGTGKPQDSVSVLVIGYVETNPVADMIKWSAELQCSGAINSTAQ